MLCEFKLCICACDQSSTSCIHANPATGTRESDMAVVRIMIMHLIATSSPKRPSRQEFYWQGRQQFFSVKLRVVVQSKAKCAAAGAHLGWLACRLVINGRIAGDKKPEREQSQRERGTNENRFVTVSGKRNRGCACRTHVGPSLPQTSLRLLPTSFVKHTVQRRRPEISPSTEGRRSSPISVPSPSMTTHNRASPRSKRGARGSGGCQGGR